MKADHLVVPKESASTMLQNRAAEFVSHDKLTLWQ